MKNEKIIIYSFNVNGIRAVDKKGVLSEWLTSHSIDIAGLQETKAHEEQLKDEIKNIGDFEPLLISKPDRKGYSGVGIYTKRKPLNVNYHIFEQEEFNSEGRVVQVEYPEFVLLNVYFPNGASKKERLDYKMRFYEAFSAHCQQLLADGKNVIVMGDVNTAHQEIDLSHPKENEKYSGFLPIERAWIDSFLKLGFVDTFRYLYPDQEQVYSWWDMKTRARERNIGWRIDYIFISQSLVPFLEDAYIDNSILGSDHCPVGITLKK